MSEPGFLPISDSMARDLDNGRADNRAVEDFIPDTVLQDMKDAQDASAVVHAENLRPISKAEAARRTMFDGEHMPALPATRRVIPAPYRRDRVIGGRHGKTWGVLKAAAILPGDIITEVGLVTVVSEEVRHDAGTARHIHDGDGTVEGCPGCFPVACGTDIAVRGMGGARRTYDAGELVQVFRKHQ